MDLELAVAAAAVHRADGQVTRLTFSEGAAVVDVPSKLVRLAEGDRARLTVWADGDPGPDWRPDLMMRGTVYSTNTDEVHASFGGLLARLPGGEFRPRVGRDVHLAITIT